MNLMTMGFGGFTWQVNPTSLRLEWARDIKETALPFAGRVLTDLGVKKRRVTGEGYFTGPECMERWQALSAAFAKGGSAYLQLPGQAPFLAVMAELKLLGEPGEDAVHYSFVFTEEKGQEGYRGGRVHKAAAGESLWDYAWRYRVPIEQMHKANPHIRDIACLEQGEEVRVP